MMFVLILIFGALALAAAAFAVLPLIGWRGQSAPRRPYLALAAGLAVLLCGLGVYTFLGQPVLALRTLTGPDNTDLPSLIASLSTRMRERPNDAMGWTILGRGYLALGQTDQAVKALARAVELNEAQGRPSVDVLISYGVALSVAGGAVTKDAEAAFQRAYNVAPANPNARYYLGYAHAERGQKEAALKLWDGLVAQAPPDAAWRQSLPGQIAALRGASPEKANPPDVQAMVQRLATRLESNPKDLEGWIMLIRSYAALGDKDKAKAALTKARSVFGGDAKAISTLDQQAHSSAVE